MESQKERSGLIVPKEQRAKFVFSDIGKHDRTTIVGKTGQGKSVLMDKLIHFFSKKTLVILIDTKNEYIHIPELNMKILQKAKGLYRIVSIEEEDNIIIDDYKVICEWISKILFDRENCLLAIEELGNVVRKYGTLYEVMPNFAKLLQQGRSHNVGFIGTTQRPQEIHTTILSQSGHIISLLITSKHDLQAMGAYIDKEQYGKLQRYEFFHLNHAKNYLRHCNRLYLSDAEIKYYSDLFGET